MKLLMFNAARFETEPTVKSLESGDETPQPCKVQDAVVAFIHVEAQDPERGNQLVTKAIKNIKWMCGKAGTKRVVLHSFSHLSSSKAEPQQARELLNQMQARLENANYEVCQTPYGWMNRLLLDAYGDSTFDRVFKEL